MFGDGTPAAALRMVDHQVTPSGAVIATYEPAGTVEQGWAGPQSHSGRETGAPGGDRGRPLVSGSQLFAHPFSSYCQKVLIALWADDTPFDYRILDEAHPENMAELKRRWPFGQFPLLSTMAKRSSRRPRSSSISRRIIPAPTAGSPTATLAAASASSTASSTFMS